MKKITKFYIDNAKYRIEDSSGAINWLEINYWKNTFKVSKKDRKLEQIAKGLLNRKHRVNFVDKLIK